jgi:GntR family transcriptional regulator of arabinose operon
MNYKRSQLRALILSSLNKGELSVGDQLPTETEMTQKYGMSRGTIREGIALLVQEGILSRRRGAGTFVAGLKPSRKGKQIAAVVACQSGQWDTFGQVVREIEHHVHDRGDSLIVCNHESRREKMDAYLQRIIEDQTAGVIFSPIQLPGMKEYNLQVVRRLEEHGIPFVLIASPISSDTLSRYSFVSSNGFEATRRIVQYLVELGHRRIGYIQGLQDVFSAQARFDGYVEEMRRCRLEVLPEWVRAIQVGQISTQGRQEVREMLSGKSRPTAVICIHDMVAKNVVEEIHSMGLSVPNDVAVVGFDDLFFAASLNPPLTTVRTPLAAEAMLDVEFLYGKIAGTHTGERQEFLACELVIRDSCGTGPRADREQIARRLSFSGANAM